MTVRVVVRNLCRIYLRAELRDKESQAMMSDGMNETLSIRKSYQLARRLSRRSGSNFYRSFWLLPKPKRDAMCALYAFARTTDDLGDCDEPLALRTRWLDWWRQTAAINLIGEQPFDHVILPDGLVESCQTTGTHGWPIDLHRRAREVLPALRHAAQQFEIPSRYLLEIIDGVLADQQKTRFDTYEQLEHYCYLVASAVGLACLHVWGFEGELPVDAAIDCGIAFQLTNILRDVAEDAERGRIYLPRHHYENHGLGEDDLLQPRSDDRLSCLVLDEVQRAKRLFASGWQVWDSLHPDGRPMFSMMWRTYRKLLTHIAEDPGSIISHRIQLSVNERLQLVSQHFFPPLFRRLPVPPSELQASSSVIG